MSLEWFQSDKPQHNDVDRPATPTPAFRLVVILRTAPIPLNPERWSGTGKTRRTVKLCPELIAAREGECSGKGEVLS